uniref:Cerebral cavernous malformations 2 harmonin-homology domain-containing protein n=1 Tax=Panagrolaimus sp. JU765 TaxID=591449 RepID=A0AC34QJV2_9BILA
MMAVASDSRSYNIKYAGWIPKIRSDIDPMSRIDLLKVLDTAETNGHIILHGLPKDFQEDASLQINPDGVKVTSLRSQDVLLTVPINMLASVGLVTEDTINIVPLMIGLDNDINDLAVIYTKTKEQALNICDFMNTCFQTAYQEIIANPEKVEKRNPVKMGMFTTDYGSGNALQSPALATEYSQTLSTSTASSPQNEEMINEYITMISVCLSQEELNQFAILMKRWRQGEIPILEFGQKLLEIYGPERKHLLARMKHLLRGIAADELDQLSKFLQANGITENAAASPLLTAEMSLTDGGSPAFDSISEASGIVPRITSCFLIFFFIFFKG